MKKAYLITKTTYDSAWIGGYNSQPYAIAFDEDFAKRFCKERTNHKKAPCGCCYEGFDYSYDEIDIMVED